MDHLTLRKALADAVEDRLLSHNLTLRKALADAVEDRLLSHNPADGAHRLHRDRPEMKTWSAEQLSSFLGSVADDEHFCLWRLAATTGMRRGELLGLR